MLLGRGAVVGWGAAAGGRDERPDELEPVARPAGPGLAGEARLEEGAEKEVARLVAREHPPGAVAAVRRRRKADDEDPGARISKGRKRPGPVRLATEAARGILRRELAPGHQPRAAPAGHDFRLHLAEAVGRQELREYLPVRAPSASTRPFMARSRSARVAPGASATSASRA